MPELTISCPAGGARIVSDGSDTILFGQPPDILKALLLEKSPGFNTLVLTDMREKGGCLTNNLEFPIYYFLFAINGLAEGRKLNLVGDEIHISQAIRLLRFTLNGPIESELQQWGTEPALMREWLDVADRLAIKRPDGNIMEVEEFFNIQPFHDDVVQLDSLSIKQSGLDQYEVSNQSGTISVDLSGDEELDPAYSVQRDFVSFGLTRLGVEVLGGASGFSADEPCTGMAVCHNGRYLLIDAMPFLDQHLTARGISKNQISSVFLTHLHDDHCAMFPLMLMPHVVEVITTKEIYAMAMEKLSCGLGWTREAVEQHFKLFEVQVGVPSDYCGLTILPHATVHTIPTIGATFSISDRGTTREICFIGDNHNMASIRELADDGVVRTETLDTLENLFRKRFNLLVADGGGGAIHGDPCDAIESQAERVVYVHADDLDNVIATTFSQAVAGKRYTIVDGDPTLYSDQVVEFLSRWLDQPLSKQWLRRLTDESEIRSYNSDDVIIVQDAASCGYVYLIVTGYCSVVVQDGQALHTIANLQAGELFGEMASVAEVATRSASIVSSTPVTVCVFPEQTFAEFVSAHGLQAKLQEMWSIRSKISTLPFFSQLSSTVHLKLSGIASLLKHAAGESIRFGNEGWYILLGGSITHQNGESSAVVDSRLSEFGWQPMTSTKHHDAGNEQQAAGTETVTVAEDAELIFIDRELFEEQIRNVPILNYHLRKYRAAHAAQDVEWLLGPVAPR